VFRSAGLLHYFSWSKVVMHSPPEPTSSKNQKPQPLATVKLRLQIAVLAINEEAICFALA
ncbi:hypothetical protein, partial [Corynebacterium sp. MSK019]|uniref:hypothetical protein n=1 Tax=Corynebacterium sp. MSK019 TaxID=3050190 RepID=UPI00254D6C78